MVVTDPIGELFARIKNAINVKRKSLSAPFSKIKLEIVKILKKEGFIRKFEIKEAGRFKNLEIDLNYDEDGVCAISNLVRVSRPGCRAYRKSHKLWPVLDGFGIAIISTTQGLLVDRQARKKKVGGEVIGYVW